MTGTRQTLETATNATHGNPQGGVHPCKHVLVVGAAIDLSEPEASRLDTFMLAQGSAAENWTMAPNEGAVITMTVTLGPASVRSGRPRVSALAPAFPSMGRVCRGRYSKNIRLSQMLQPSSPAIPSHGRAGALFPDVVWPSFRVRLFFSEKNWGGHVGAPGLARA